MNTKSQDQLIAGAYKANEERLKELRRNPTRPEQAEHSPLPWESVIHDNYGLIIRKKLRDGLNAGLVAGIFGQEAKPSILSGEAQANAAYIVQACNEYPKLIEALKDCITDSGSTAFAHPKQYAARRLQAINETVGLIIAQCELSNATT